MYCPYCGAWNPEDSKFCGKCGRRLQAASQSRQGRGKGLCLLLAVIGTFLILLVVAGSAFLLRERLALVWQSFVARPTAALVIPTETPSPTPMPMLAAVTPSPSPSPSPTATELPIPTSSPTATATPLPPQRTFKIIYRNCIPHALSLGSVKGQVFDRTGRVIPGAKVRIMINGYEWQSDANPATTNVDGWYEWVLEPGQRVKFVELIVNGKSVPFTPRDLEVVATSGCFQRVDFVEQ
ncbi:MAG: zinc-ribbon domain-containing protein [Chloroflexi bacterium]|nr:zinc-ribbon domain-containing protein [Chloroflexota bacterium]